jgi:hypothetical protein
VFAPGSTETIQLGSALTDLSGSVTITGLGRSRLVLSISRDPERG